jgi:hypothetical protein
MGSFKRALLGYRRSEVDAAIANRDGRIGELDRELSYLSGMMLERERQIRELQGALSDLGARHDRSIATLEAVTARLDEIHAQARGQATRIRMKALREAVEVTRRVQELSARAGAAAAANGNGTREIPPAELFEGLVKVDIGPLGDFSQLVGFEDAVGQIGATAEISVERFSEGRATLSMRLAEPVALLRELEERSPLGFRVRQNGGDRLVLDVETPEVPQQRAA